MFPKAYETTVYTEQITVSPQDLFINPQAGYTPPIDTNRVSFKFSSSHVTDPQFIMFPKMFETAFYTEQCPRDSFIIPPASVAVYQPQAGYTPHIDTNRVSFKFSSQAHSLLCSQRRLRLLSTQSNALETYSSTLLPVYTSLRLSVHLQSILPIA